MAGILGRRRRATLEDRSDEEVNIKAKLPVTSDGEAQELLEEVRAELESITGIDTGMPPMRSNCCRLARLSIATYGERHRRQGHPDFSCPD